VFANPITEGYNYSRAAGRSHQKRKFYEDDKDRIFKNVTSTYVEEYLKGYKYERRENAKH